MKVRKNFTLVEFIVVIVIIAVLASIVAPNAFKTIEKAKIVKAKQDAKTLRSAVGNYFSDMGFYPPDVYRGDDPGFMKRDYWNPDNEPGYPILCYPEDFPTTQQAERLACCWKGPYLERWPYFTPWGGKYDYNYWPEGGSRYGVNLPPGVYIGIQRNYDDEDKTGIPPKSEQVMVDDGTDADGAVNGEVQLLLFRL